MMWLIKWWTWLLTECCDNEKKWEKRVKQASKQASKQTLNEQRKSEISDDNHRINACDYDDMH
jgi:hypothetical protein